MHLADMGGVLRRRWYLAAVGLILTLGGVLLALQMFPPTYETKAVVLLLPPKTSVGSGENPYLLLDGLQTAADVLSRSMMDSESAKIIGSNEYLVAPDVTTNGPLILVTVETSSRAESEEIMTRLLERVPVALDELQSSNPDVAPTFRIQSTVITLDEPSLVWRTPTRAAIVAGAAGLALTLLAVMLIDAFLARRRSDSDETRPGATA